MKILSARGFWAAVAVLTAIILLGLLFAARSWRLMILHHGTPEVPGGRAFAIMNPFRDRRPEEVAQQLMADLRTDRCGEILRELHSDGDRICPVVHDETKPSLIWREDGKSTRVLVYDLPRSKSRLWITSTQSEGGFVVSGVTLIR